MSEPPLPVDFPTFSVFRALRVERHEIRHSNFLAWLIDPRESHNQGPLFLGHFLRAVGDVVGESHTVAVKVRRTDACGGDVEIRREADRLDLRLVLPEVKVVIGIENKVFASEHSDKLARYADSTLSDFTGWDCVLLYLTLDGDVPSDSRWLPITHRHILAIIEDGIGCLPTTTPPAVRIFIQHYLELLRDIYRTRPARNSATLAVESVEDVQEPSEVPEGELWKLFNPDKKLAGWDNFEAALRKIVRVPKTEVDKRIEENKAARIERRRGRSTPS